MSLARFFKHSIYFDFPQISRTDNDINTSNNKFQIFQLNNYQLLDYQYSFRTELLPLLPDYQFKAKNATISTILFADTIIQVKVYKSTETFIIDFWILLIARSKGWDEIVELKKRNGGSIKPEFKLWDKNFF